MSEQQPPSSPASSYARYRQRLMEQDRRRGITPSSSREDGEATNNGAAEGISAFSMAPPPAGPTETANPEDEVMTSDSKQHDKEIMTTDSKQEKDIPADSKQSADSKPSEEAEGVDSKEEHESEKQEVELVVDSATLTVQALTTPPRQRQEPPAHWSLQAHAPEDELLPPMVSTVPTVTSWDESTQSSSAALHLGRVRHRAHQQQPRHRPPLDRPRAELLRSTPRVYGDATPTRSTRKQLATPPRSHGSRNEKSPTPSRSTSRQSQDAATSTSAIPSAAAARPRRRRKANIVPPEQREFQQPSDICSVRVQHVNTEQRSAFELNPCPTTQEWQAAASLDPQVTASTHQRNGPAKKRLSPSLPHLELLQTMQKMTVLRQVDFSASTGLDADLYDEDEFSDSKSGGTPSSRRRKERRDGRYRSIDPVKATVQQLPDSIPLLSNKKRRLPNRADVGFANPDPADVQRKQDEIRHETQWEEASPRLAVLVTSNDLGTAVLSDQQSLHSKQSSSSNRRRHLRWNGGGLPGIPFAGRPLMEAMDRNAKFFGQPSTMGLGDHQQNVPFQKRNPYSMLAPPLDASFSPSQDWRPRPFNDRPPGMAYLLACPTHVHLETSDGTGNGGLEQQPLLGSLTLYSLPAHPRKGDAYGKMSEEFYFPVGDWTGKVLMEAVRDESTGQVDNGLVAQWFRRKHKAVFTYDPLKLVGGCESLFVVLQIYRIGHSPNVPGDTNQQHDAVADEWHRQKADRVFQQFGTQLMSPLCFGVSNVYPASDEQQPQNKMDWPLGETRDISLHAFPAVSESQEGFVDRLVHMVHSTSGSEEEATNELDDSSTTSSDFRSTISVASSTDSPVKRRSKLGRLFLSPRRQKASVGRGTTSQTPQVVEHLPDFGKATVFLSVLSVDFLQVMLSTPAEIAEEPETSLDQKPLPHLLSDVTGDFAVSFDGNESLTALPATSVKKRSTLLRLPIPPKAASYVGSSEFREVLYLAPRPERHYDVDSPVSYRSLFNFLYLYPRVLRLSEGGKVVDCRNFAIRMRAVQSQAEIDTETGVVESRTTPLSVFHNSAPWAGPGLMNSVYTHVSNVAETEPHDLYSKGVEMKDEIKMRLPRLIDGSYFLEITLCLVDYSAETPSDEITLRHVADAKIPLSSTTSLDGVSSSRVTTVIPNGNHRVKLGDFQLQLETRLISSIHVGDPAVALALREFPYAKAADGADDASSTLSSSPSKDVVFFNDTLPAILSVSSESSLLGYFQAFLYMHLSNLVNDNAKRMHAEPSVVTSLLMANMRCLFETLRRVKSKVIAGRSYNKPAVSSFLKRSLDSFDEGFISPVSNPWAENSSVSIEVPSEDVSESVPADTSISQDEKKSVDEMEDGEKYEGAVRIRSRELGRRNSQHDIRVARIVAALGTSEDIPFSREAYGATKTDRMRLEAELYNTAGHLEHFFDDDETIGTSLTHQTAVLDAQKVQVDTPIVKGVWNIDPEESDDNSILRSSSSSSRAKKVSQQHLNGHAEFAQRVKTAAQIMLAPCVGPSFSNILSRANPPQADDGIKADDRKIAESIVQTQTSHSICAPSSDIEDEITRGDKDDQGSGVQLTETVFRGPGDSPLFLFSIKNLDEQRIPIASGEYVYETIMVLWLRAWIDHLEGSVTEELDSLSPKFGTVVMPEHDLSRAGEFSVFSFYANIDFILPLCLKSIVLRYSVEVLPVFPRPTKVMVDGSHMFVLELFVETLSRGLMGEVLSGLGTEEKRDKSLLRALSSADTVLDFLVGLIAVLHPEHMRVLISAFFKTLRDGETEHISGSTGDGQFEWSEESLHRVRCSRQIRLHAVEVFAVLPCFASLNYPMKYTSDSKHNLAEKSTWVHQYSDVTKDNEASDVKPSIFSDGVERLPVSGWLAELVLNEGLSICSLSCEAVVAEAMAHLEVSQSDASKTASLKVSALKKRPGAALKREDLLMFESLAVHAVTSVYELVVRRHAMDRRFQTESARGRLAALFALPIFEKSIASARWLARMETTHKVRSLWLLSFAYVLQECPEGIIRDFVRSLCHGKDVRIHRLIRLLRLSSSTFQSFVDLPRHSMFPSEIDQGLSPWLLQESFNTICAASNIVVDECVKLTSGAPREQTKMMQGILDLFLHVLTTPQSPVTHLRALGGALTALEQFGAELFLEVTGSGLQHWIRVVLSLMNSISLSVRSISVDFVVSLLGGTYDLRGNIDDLTIVFVTVLPEVVAREIGLYSVSAHISSLEDVAKSLWPLRRAIADLQDTDPLDDNRVDPELAPVLSVFCRACQAAIDGVLIEMRLKGDELNIVGTEIHQGLADDFTFDADEESLFELASFFLPETGPMQRIRWLLTLKTLHEAKGHWVEAAETLVSCAKTISDSVLHLKNVWRPSHFVLWWDSRRSLWLETVGEDAGKPDRGNSQVMDFAVNFLEPADILGSSTAKTTSGKLQQPTVASMCSMLSNVTSEAVGFYLREGNVDDLAYTRLESLLKTDMKVLDEHSSGRVSLRSTGMVARKRHVEEEAALRLAAASLSGDMTSLSERLLLGYQNDPNVQEPGKQPTSFRTESERPCFVVIRLFGRKPDRFQESTTIPTFLEWDSPCICRIPNVVTRKPACDENKWAKKVSLEFAQTLVASLRRQSNNPVFLRTQDGGSFVPDPKITYVAVVPVKSENASGIEQSLVSKHFVYRKTPGDTSQDDSTAVLVELRVAHAFPCCLSRQRSVLTSEIVASHRAAAMIEGP